MNPYIYILEPSKKLDITKHLHTLQTAADNGEDIYWNAEGWVRVLPLPALKNALELYSDWTRYIETQDWKQLPEWVRYIQWHELSPNPHESYSVVTNGTILDENSTKP